MKSKKPRDSAAIAQKARVTKARKVLAKWADENVRLELVVPGSTLRVRGTIRQIGAGIDDGFLFLSDSREISSRIFLTLWKTITVEQQGSFGIAIHFRSQIGHDGGITLIEERGAKSDAEEMLAVIKQLRLWIKLRLPLFSAVQFSFVGSYSACTINEASPGVFELRSNDTKQVLMLDPSSCGHAEVQNRKSVTVVTLTSRTGNFLVMISDSLSQVEAAYKLSLGSEIIH